MRLHVATEDEIRRGETADVYFRRIRKVLEEEGLADTEVVAEISTRSLPEGWEWGVLCGVEEALALLEGRDVTVYAMDEGEVFRPGQPVMRIEGPYVEFCELETALIGCLAKATGIATKAARCKVAAGGKPVYSFGIRRQHPAIAPMVDRAAYVGGCDGVSGIKGAELIGERPVGTMPHAFVLVFGDQRKAWRAFDEHVPEDVPRIALVDTMYDEVEEALMAAEELRERLDGVRLDTPSSRRGDMAEIVREVRWELDLRGYEHVKIMVSGGLDEGEIRRLAEVGADAFGVGTAISDAPAVDFAMDLVEIEGEPRSKRGKLSGAKQVWRCPNCLDDVVLPRGKEPSPCPECGSEREPLLRKFVEEGEVVREPKSPKEARRHVLETVGELEGLDLTE
ncbi:nicotinate phosphoribosyltransferase [Methanopyrus kandleri]|uniref:nicotinate phosphoribosyltransferase n=2 Tax=Methanopyrus kandleri TaxID=2320 RepID=Q8TVI9_METKA|nr:nicotinate phosphoribosyltransferase [Methanopyrus kandleri]AAM02613.1 Nicotinic acid phosphoribosyltransferase [Methanopyrus kandleri AV19]HII70271.1 nicotinate phosphoribosyltransferase [Methanopyrus kandleri]